MSESNEENTNEIISTLQIEVKTNKGQIKLPGKEAILLTDNSEDEVFVLPEKVALYKNTMVRVGRDKTNDLVLDIPSVSRFHAMFTVASSVVTLSDLSSTNGTFINRIPISTPVQLMDESVIAIGPAKITIEINTDGSLDTDSHVTETQIVNLTHAAVVTVFVVDVCNYTRLTEVLPGKDMVAMLQVWTDKVSKIIQQFGGEVDKYIGDCVMAFWSGSIGDAKLMANKAAEASVMTLKETQKLSKSQHWAHQDAHPWDCRVSLNTGEVMMGAIGTRGSRDFSIWGDVVNVAFRLNSKARELGSNFVVSASTADYIKEAFKLKNLGPVKVKGHSQEIVVYDAGASV